VGRTEGWTGESASTHSLAAFLSQNTNTHFRLLSHTIHTRLLNPSLLPSLLHSVRTAIFPNNTLGPARPVPSTPAEIAVIRHACAEAVYECIPPIVRGIYFPPSTASATHSDADAEKDEAMTQIEALLDVLGDAYLNKHLVFALLDHVVCRLFPEMKDVGVEDLVRDRL